MSERIEELSVEVLTTLKANPDGLSRQALFTKTSAVDDGELSKAVSLIKDDVIRIGHGKSTVYMPADVSSATSTKTGRVSASKPSISNTPKSQYSFCAKLDPETDQGLVAYVLFLADALLSTQILVKRIHVFDPTFRRQSVYSAVSNLTKMNYIKSEGTGKNVVKGWKDKSIHPFDGRIVPSCAVDKNITSDVDTSPDCAEQKSEEVARGVTELGHILQRVSPVCSVPPSSDINEQQLEVAAISEVSKSDLVDLLTQAMTIAANANALVESIKAKM